MYLGPDITGVRARHIVTEADSQLSMLKLTFSYDHRNLILVRILADEKSVYPTTIFRGVPEPTLSYGASHVRKVLQQLPPSCTVYCKLEVAIVDAFIFPR